ncbi:MAG: DUF1501 domain-containing protein [Flavobacteriales bacterium]
MKRRQFLKNTAPAIMLPGIINNIPLTAFAENPILNSITQAHTETDRVLVMVFLNGGNDGLNTVLPLDQYTNLANARQNILIQQNQALALNGVNNTGLHPAMTGMRDLFNQGKMQIIQSVGYPQPDFSHFRATDIWLSASDSNEYLQSGWVGRYLDSEFPGFPTGYPNSVMPDPLAISIGANVPLLFQGPAAQMGMTVGTNIFDPWNTGLSDAPPGGYAGTELSYVRLIASQTQSYASQILNALIAQPTNGNFYPNIAEGNYLAEELKYVARTIKGGLKTRIYLVGLYGFDTHASQAEASNHSTGAHAQLLTHLSKALKGFQDDIAAMGIEDRVLTMVFSEFGRRIASNGSLGTDHGAAAPMFIMGSKIHGGVLGTNPSIPSVVSGNDNLPMQYDFRSVYASILSQWFCVPENVLQTIITHNYQQLPIVDPACITGIEEVNSLSDALKLTVYPNPMTSSAYAEFEIMDGFTRLELYDPLGRLMKVYVSTMKPAGKYKVYLENENFRPGNYFLRLENGPLQKTCNIIVTQ